jgi:hypothetical protein
LLAALIEAIADGLPNRDADVIPLAVHDEGRPAAGRSRRQLAGDR